MNKHIAIPKRTVEFPQKPNKSREQKMAAIIDGWKSIASELEMDLLLPRILEQLGRLVHYHQAALFLLEQGKLTRRCGLVSTGESLTEPGFQADSWDQLLLAQPELAALASEIHQPVAIIRDSSNNGVKRAGDPLPAVVTFRRHLQVEIRHTFPEAGEWTWIPLPGHEQVLGGILMQTLQPNAFTGEHLDLAWAAAGLAGISIENARAYGQAREQAALQERQKLARELHDSVSQALYGIALGAKTARALLANHPEKAIEPVDYVISLASSGLAEMRALIFELRPEALVEEGLVAAITTQARAFQARHQIEVSFTPVEEPPIPYPKKEALYRVVMEAFNNIARHADATQVTIRLEYDPATLCLEVIDNGLGFQPGSSFPGHLGLQSMRQRIEAIGGTFIIQSAPGQGTSLQIRVHP